MKKLNKELWKALFIWNKSKIDYFINFRESFIDYLKGKEIKNKKMKEGIEYHQLITRFFKEQIEIREIEKIKDKILKNALLKILEFEKNNNLKLIAIEKTFQSKLKLKELQIKNEIESFIQSNFRRDTVIVNGRIDFLLKDNKNFYILELKLNNFKEDLFYPWLFWKINKRTPILITFNIKEGNLKERPLNKNEIINLDYNIKKTIKEGIEFIYFNKNKFIEF